MKFHLATRLDWIRASISVAILLMMAIGGTGITSMVTAQVPLTATKIPYQDYGLSAFGIKDNVSLSLLQKATGNNLSVSALEQYIRSQLLSYDVRRVLFDIGWENYDLGQIPHESWVDNWFTACDSMGVGNVLFVGQLTKSGIGSTWVSSLIKADPSAQTSLPDGRPASYVSPDNPDVITYLEHDLATLYSFYGQHTSWIGIGTGSTPMDPYYNPNSSMPALGYSNATLANFANSKYFAADINSTGFGSTGVLDTLWAEFRNLSPSSQLSSGNWQLSIPVPVYGNATAGNSLAMRFYLPGNLSMFQIEWYGSKQTSTAGNISAQIIRDSAGKLATNAVVSSQVQTSISITQTEGWQGPLVFRGDFSRGYYWLYLTSPSTTKPNSYQIFVRNYPVDNLNAQNLGNTTGDRWSNIGQTILWLKGANGITLAVSPYVQPLVQPRAVQSFTAASSFAFNTIYLFLSDRHYDPTNGTITVTDATLNKTIASGVLSQSLNRGLQNWIPITLDHVLVAQKGHNYVMTITEPRHGISWIVVLRGLVASPSEGGFQGQSEFWLFRLALVNWGESHTDFTSDVSNGIDAVTLGHPDAISFSVPGSSGGHAILSGLSVFMHESNPSGRFYPSTVNMTLSIHANNQTAGVPIKKPIQSMNLIGSSIPQRGWLNATGFNLTLSSGNTYWVVFSTNSQKARFPMARLVSPYNLKVLGSLDGGTRWTFPGEGPTEFAFVARFSDG
ncbi:MAG TPA: hypothetical protein VGR56_02295, partial [Nitrososphaerales archaeon]|nr:hypothetical protein [Nitrososphaerales archaeon]